MFYSKQNEDMFRALSRRQIMTEEERHSWISGDASADKVHHPAFARRATSMEDVPNSQNGKDKLLEIYRRFYGLHWRLK
jgi:hypothetical protein